MSTFLPSQEAIRWSIRSGQLHNVQSARVSMPAQIKRVPHSQVAAQESAQIADTLVEEPSIDDGKPQRAADSEVFTWRVDLAKTGSWRRSVRGRTVLTSPSFFKIPCSLRARVFKIISAHVFHYQSLTGAAGSRGLAKHF